MSLGAPPVFTSLCALRGVQTDMSIFSKHLANEVAGRGVRINRVTRAGVLAERMECRMPEGAKRQAAASGPPGRMGQRRPCRRRCTSYRRRRPESWASRSTLLVVSRSLDPRRWKAPVAHRSSYYREPSSQEHSDEPAKLSILQRLGDGRRPARCGFWVRGPDLLGGRGTHGPTGSRHPTGGGWSCRSLAVAVGSGHRHRRGPVRVRRVLR